MTTPRDSLETQFALLAGIAIGLAHNAGDETLIVAILKMPAVKVIGRKEPQRLLGQMMLSRGISLEEE